jgi:UDP-N-acetylmuramoyl-tripeptide--D-alanyl-D-alanine ligase
MQRVLTRYRPSYPIAVVYLLHMTGYRLSSFWHRYTAVADWSRLPPKKFQPSLLPKVLVVLVFVLMVGALVWLALLWKLLTPLTPNGLLFLVVYSLLWLYAVPVVSALAVAAGASTARLLKQLVTPSGLRVLLRTWVARRLESQVVRLIRERNPLVIGVTGSVGKTSTKLAIAHLLSTRYHVLAHQGNYNTEIGLPLAIFELEVPTHLTNPLIWVRILREVHRRRRSFAYDAMVLELGADQPGDIAKFMRYLTPHIGVLTAIAPVHTEQFGSVEAILDEKWLLARGSQRVLINADDERLVQQRAELTEDVVMGFGIENGDWQLSKLRLAKNGYEASLRRPDDKPLKVKTHALARHSLYALIAAAAVADWGGVSGRDIRRQLESWRPVKGRMSPLSGKKGSLIIDDTYNSSPDAAIAALDALYTLEGRHIAILGSMNELGEFEAEGHRQVGAQCGKLDLLVTIGRAANEFLAPAARKAGLRAKQVAIFDSPYEAGSYLVDMLKKNDVVLAKGSQNGVFAEEAVKLLLANLKDREQLVRQSPEWLREKESQFPVS